MGVGAGAGARTGPEPEAMGRVGRTPARRGLDGGRGGAVLAEAGKLLLKELGGGPVA